MLRRKNCMILTHIFEYTIYIPFVNFKPLSEIWQKTINKIPQLNTIMWPLYFFDEIDLIKMCDFVEIVKDVCPLVRKCSKHRLVRATNALLGVACGPWQQKFQLSFSCLRKVVDSKRKSCLNRLSGKWFPIEDQMTKVTKCKKNLKMYYSKYTNKRGCMNGVSTLPPSLQKLWQG